MVKIFISYRRADTQYVTDIVYEYMVRHFSKSNVFLDVGSIPFGVDFRKYLNEQVAAHDVVLVIIGPDWARIMQERANRRDDFVRIEIESALKQDKLLIPVLVKNATMPDFSTLPESIRELQWRNSATVRRQPDLENDCNRLAEGIKQYAASVGLGAPAITDILPPPFAWIDIPAGRVTLKKGGYLEEDKTFDVPAFQIAKYPITNAQFRQFIEAGGYRERRYWTEAGWQVRESQGWTEPGFWTDERFVGDDKPVVGVSWYEAIAYCHWLSLALTPNPSPERSAGRGAYSITLPTEQQWQRAAQGDDGRLYPWGNKFDPAHANTYESRIGQTTPVTAYEGRDKGNSPYGVVDMAGNVWEWTLTAWEDGSTVTKDSTRRVLRGGSWINPHRDARAASRDDLDVNPRRSLKGLRLVRAPSP